MQHIMIIEDETNIREELMLLLESVPYRVSAPKPEGDLLTLIREARPDLILLDLGLPGIDGLTLCSLLRKESAVPIIFVTGRNTSMDELNCLLRGGDDFLSKPYQPAQDETGRGCSPSLEKFKARSGFRNHIPAGGKKPSCRVIQK